MTLTAGPDAGWYPDPAGDRAWRWWDGATWTDHLRARETEPVSAPVAIVPDPVVVPEPVEFAPQPAVAAAPVVQPAPAAIPQPGDVAAAPQTDAPAAGNVSTTPAIPVTDQAYWHSSAAEVIDVPRVSSTSRQPAPRATAPVPSYVRDWNDLGSPHTAGIWLLAFGPLIGGAVYFFVGQAMQMASLPPIVSLLAGVAAATLLHWLFAALDARALAARGYHAPRLAWMLLFPPLAYFIARGKAVRRESKSAWQPELVFVICLLVNVAVIVLLSAAAIAVLTSLGAF